MASKDGRSSEVPRDTTMAAATPVQQFYAGASVLVTGGTGFMGKVLLEKLLWAFPDITAIYVVVRPKKGVAGTERITALLASQCFDRLRAARGPEFGSKLVAVPGDVTQERLGISDLDLDLLTRHVSIVFHVAATVRFNEPLHVAVTQNVRGTRELLQLCKTFTQLKSVVHVSTAYSHCPRHDIEERFYESPMDCDEAIKMAAADTCALASGQTTPALTEKLLGAWPNTYTFTKALAEQVVQRHGHGLPVCVFRPAIVSPSYHEPAPGWVDNMAGPAGILVGILTGFIRVLPGNTTDHGALVPCDMAISAMIAAAWDVAQRPPAGSSSSHAIYNFTPSASNLVTWCKYLCTYDHYFKEIPSIHAIWITSCVQTKSRVMMIFYRFVLQAVPGAIADVVLKLTGRKPFVCRVFGKVDKALDANSYFSTQEWNFEEKNLVALWERMGSADRQLLDFDMRPLDWDLYVKTTSPGIRKFALKDDPATIPAGKRKRRRMKLTRHIFKMFVYLAVLFHIISSLWLSTSVSATQ